MLARMETAAPAPAPLPGPRCDLAWFAFLLPLALAVWALRGYPEVLRRGADQTYLLQVSAWTLVKLVSVFYGLYLLPGLAFFARRWPTERWRDALGGGRLLLAFAFGMTAHVFAALLQKTLHLGYRPISVLACLGAAYLVLGWLAGKIPMERLLREAPGPRPERPERLATYGLLALGGALLLEMTLRARGSSLNLSGDGYPHLINTLGTMVDGPFPDGLPFFSTFVLNIHPMGFHALLANLKTLTPGLLYIDLFRYFSVLMVPVFLVCMYGFFSFLGKSRLVGALGAFAALFVSGGGLSLGIPIVYFPWYWSIAWCLSAAVFYILLKSELSSAALCFAAGLVFGAGVLLHPFFALRMGAIMACFLPLELLRRAFCRQPLGPALKGALDFGLGLAIPVAAWLGPLLAKHPWEPTYEFEYIVKNFSALAPEGVEYLKTMKGKGFALKDLWHWSWKNAGLAPILLAPLGLAACVARLRDSAAALLAAWLIAMGAATLLDLLPNPYRYFEYFFFGVLALAVYGAGWLLGKCSGVPRALAISVLLCVAALQIPRDFFPKYSHALRLYGTTALTEADIRSAESRSARYLESKRAGRLDLEYGGYRGYLWSRQKKVWDIYLKTRKPAAPAPAPKGGGI